MRICIRCLALGMVVLAFSTSLFSYEREKFLNFVFFNLPAEYFADIPLEKRPGMFQDIVSDPKTKAINYGKGNLFFRKESGSEGRPVYLWLKLLPRESDSPLVYVHRATLVSSDPTNGESSYIYDTKVVMWKRRSRDVANWLDVTEATMPKTVDLDVHLPPNSKFNGVSVLPNGYRSFSSSVEVLVWDGLKFHLRKAYPFGSSTQWEGPLDAERLSILAFQADPDCSSHRELAELIAHAAVTKDDRFRSILEFEHLRQIPDVSYALAAYEYALDQSAAAIDFIVEKVAEEGNGDTDSKWMLAYFDEWDKTLEVYQKYDGRDGAAAEAGYMFVKLREYFFPENFKKFWAKKMNEIGK